MKLNSFITLVAFTSCFAGCEMADDPNRELKQTVADLNKKCPAMLDSETRIDAIEYKDVNTVIYRHTLVNLLTRNVDTAQFHRLMWPGLLSTVRVTTEMERIRENKTTLVYDYRDKNHLPVYTFTIRPSDYE